MRCDSPSDRTRWVDRHHRSESAEPSDIHMVIENEHTLFGVGIPNWEFDKTAIIIQEPKFEGSSLFQDFGDDISCCVI